MCLTYETGGKKMWHRLAGVSLTFGGGMTAIVAYILCSTVAWLLYPGPFTPVKNWLSDLGNRSENPEGALFYNLGCAITAAALLLFVLGLSRWRAGPWRRNALIATSQITGVASVVSLALLGLYSEDRMRQHMVYSNWFFACFPLFIVLLSTGLISHPKCRKRVGLLGFAVVLLGLAFHLVLPGSRPLEWMTELGFLVYVGLVAWSSRSSPTSEAEAG